MLRATISLPTPLSPVMSTLASERATRSTSCCSAMISGLRPTSSTLVFIRMPASELVRTPTSTPVAVIVMSEVSEKKVVFGVRGQKRCAQFVSMAAGPGRRDSLYLDRGLERAAVDVNAQSSLVAGGQRTVGGEQHARPADVHQLDRRDHRHRRRLILNPLPHRAASLASFRTTEDVVCIHPNRLVRGRRPICTVLQGLRHMGQTFV